MFTLVSESLFFISRYTQEVITRCGSRAVATFEMDLFVIIVNG